jgi:hypothetical protein
MADVDVGTIADGVTVADVPTAPAISTMSVNPSIVDAITVADVVSTVPSFTIKLYRGTNAVTVASVDQDWYLVRTYKQFASGGVKLKGIILIPGVGASTFSIKDIDEDGAYLYYGAVSAATVIVYPGSSFKPMIDFSECSLSAGNKVTFVW